MKRQAVFRKISKILERLGIILLILCTIVAGKIVYSAFKEYTDTHVVNMSQFYHNIAIYISIIAMFSIIIGVLLSGFMLQIKRIRKTIITAALIFYVIIAGFIFQFTIFQYWFSAIIFMGYILIFIVCELLAVIPDGTIAKVKHYIKSQRNGV